MCTFDESIGALLPLLRCPACHSSEPLDVAHGVAKVETPIKLDDSHLRCRDCETPYPITSDRIPIMWDKELRSIYAEINRPESEPSSTTAANVAIYDDISDHYDSYTRKYDKVAKRMQHAARKALRLCPDSEKESSGSEPMRYYHLDYGCGPGHVMSWLKKFGFRQIGLDVSLKNLRNARKNTGCLVVCGNACNMPFSSKTIDLITESSVLHHIFDWKSALSESIRVCHSSGGIVIDCEPSREQMAWSPLAILVFNARFPVYKVLSYFRRDKYLFRNTAQAKLNLQAEIHHQPGTGFPLEEIEAMFDEAGFRIDIIVSPTPELASKSIPTWKSLVLNLLSARNPWNPKYGAFTAIGSNKEPDAK